MRQLSHETIFTIHRLIHVRIFPSTERNSIKFHHLIQDLKRTCGNVTDQCYGSYQLSGVPPRFDIRTDTNRIKEEVKLWRPIEYMCICLHT